MADVTDETMTATTTINAPAEAVFAVLTDPASHAAIDGTGWVRGPRDRERLSASGQVFRVAMYHDNHPDGQYEMANKVVVFDPPRAISWQPGQYPPGGGELQVGGWSWRYDLTPTGPAQTKVTLTYDWSATPAPVRQHISFPPFPPQHLHNSLRHLAELVTPPA